jgi:hypothetical protein
MLPRQTKYLRRNNLKTVAKSATLFVAVSLAAVGCGGTTTKEVTPPSCVKSIDGLLEVITYMNRANGSYSNMEFGDANVDVTIATDKFKALNSTMKECTSHADKP